MGKLIILFSLIFSSFSVTNKADSALQAVLELEEVKAYFSKSPRFSASQSYNVVLLKEPQIELTEKPSINSIPVKIVDLTSSTDKSEFIGYIQLNQLRLKKSEAEITLDIQNAVLLQEQKKKVRLTAELKIIDNEWKVSKHSFQDINISE